MAHPVSAGTSSSSTVTIHKPNSDHPSLADSEGGFDRAWFMGRWGVEWSTLPMWKDKRDVVISYEPVASGSKINTIFTSNVEYHKGSASKGSKPSSVKGTETLSTGMNGANFDWKGSGMLFFVHSHWEVLGYGKDEESQLEWAVTFFSKTLFTPAGIDIYLRRLPTETSEAPSSVADSAKSVKTSLKNRIIQAIQSSEDEGIRNLAKGGFDVPSEGV